ncbi:ABC transporter ATP-binding protein (plasmid) [Diaphorobacter sp. HDW4B]|uniref:ABC transporter ATP-binding protein n=1 Tax=Diaphorobacter sp. HDW4B TaxID=2714925 RepID=UPI0014075ABF|nr:ABC transporter ATP-binding protein [Diaphorobacter sp. HDW4B]QIL73818.1 ABC transporter ATP-binding protein [Diaphorobacter sp. HDW4B]
MENETKPTKLPGQLACRQLCVQLEQRTVLNHVDFQLSPGELVGIIGSNGAGKSSLLKALMGLYKPVAGDVTFAGDPILTLSPKARAQSIAYVAQGNQLHWSQRVDKVVALGLIPHGRTHGPDGQSIVHEVMRQADIDHLKHRNVLTLSGGERARVLLARALAVQAPVLLADEPLSALDPAHQLRIMQLLSTQAQTGTAVAVVLHDLTLAMRYCSRIVILHQGFKLADAAPLNACTNENLMKAFGIRVARIEYNEGSFALPWELSA